MKASHRFRMLSELAASKTAIIAIRVRAGQALATERYISTAARILSLAVSWFRMAVSSCVNNTAVPCLNT